MRLHPTNQRANISTGRPRIAILGAGPAGLCTAAIVLRSSTTKANVTIFERDQRERDQGAGWDIDPAAKKALGLAGVDWRDLTVEGADTWRIYKINDPETPVCTASPPEILKWWSKDRSQPETSRQKMRDELLASLDKTDVQIQWGTPVMNVASSGSEAVLLDKNDEVLGTFDIVVDASGMASRLRHHVIEEEAGTDQHYHGVTMINGFLPDVTKLDPVLRSMIGPFGGTVEIVGDRGSGAFVMSIVFVEIA
jgi:2-polyprenyl-6-methoxyphenol hydroxylase-like FAD-dependent oxidoreductase